MKVIVIHPERRKDLEAQYGPLPDYVVDSEPMSTGRKTVRLVAGDGSLKEIEVFAGPLLPERINIMDLGQRVFVRSGDDTDGVPMYVES